MASCSQAASRLDLGCEQDDDAIVRNPCRIPPAVLIPFQQDLHRHASGVNRRVASKSVHAIVDDAASAGVRGEARGWPGRVDDPPSTNFSLAFAITQEHLMTFCVRQPLKTARGRA